MNNTATNKGKNIVIKFEGGSTTGEGGLQRAFVFRVLNVEKEISV